MSKKKPDFMDNIMDSWEPEFVISSGSYLLDSSPALSNYKGIPSGSIVHLFSRSEGSFKTSYALAGLARIQEKGHPVLYVDAEHAIVGRQWIENFGIDTTHNWYLGQPASGEQAFEMIEGMIINHDVKGVVLDSVDAAQPSSILENEYGDASIGTHAKLVTSFMRRIIHLAKKHNVIVYLINQMKVNLTQMGARGYKATGGSGINFLSTINIELNRGSDGKLKGEDLIPLTINVKRSKLGQSFVEIESFAKQGVGIDLDSELVIIAQDKGLLKKAGSWWADENGETIGQGMPKAVEWVKLNKDKII